MNLNNAKRSEDTEQIAVVMWAQYHLADYPELKWLHHIPNGGSRNKLEAVKMKQMGVKAGVSDLFLPCARGIYCGLYIEMKYNQGRVQESQKDFLTEMTKRGYYTAICYTAEDAVAVLKEYCELLTEGTWKMREDGIYKNVCYGAAMAEENCSIWKDGEVKRPKWR